MILLTFPEMCIRDSLSTVPEEVTARTCFDYSMDYTSYLLEETPATEQPAEETPKLKGYELIDDLSLIHI